MEKDEDKTEIPMNKAQSVRLHQLLKNKPSVFHMDHRNNGVSMTTGDNDTMSLLNGDYFSNVHDKQKERSAPQVSSE